ncbi:MAG: twin-arginine translocation signal domain-containing protein [Phycisphaerae bacterium]|nr:twin-arginine translocation signal domain-containing protein [Phycisphaerae bacterium]
MVNKLNRRGFLKGTAMTGLGAMFPYVLPGSAIGKNGMVAPSNRIVMGAIGVGSMGQGDLNGFLNKQEVQFVAVCDVDTSHAAQAKKMVDD